MLEKGDLEAIRTIMQEELRKSENLVLQEVDRVQCNLELKMERIQKNMEELAQYYRISKLENENNTLLLQMIQDLRKEVEELKVKIA